MAMNRDKFRNIVGGITTPPKESQPLPAAEPLEPAKPARLATLPASEPPAAGEGIPAAASAGSADHAGSGDSRRFAKRGRPKGSKQQAPTGTGRKVKVSLFLSETIVNDLYEWAHDDRLHPGEMFELALKPFHEREAKRRKAGKE